MAFMTAMLLVVLGVAVWVYFHTNPRGVPARPLAICNVLVFLAAVTAGVSVGMAFHSAAVVAKGTQTGLPAYLSVMAGSTVFLVAMALGGMARNYFVFPPEKRAASAQTPPHHTPYN